MSEIELHEQHVNDTAPVPAAPSRLEQWADDAAKAYQVAQSLSKTAFVPRAMQGKPEDITGAILTGAEMGLQPMAAIRSINIIQGTPALTAVALRGLVQSRGHEVWVEKQTDTEAVVCGRRAGTEQVQRSRWTIDRAKRLGLTGKDNWAKQPQAMLVARATSEVCRLIAADVLLGLPYTVEELDDQQTERRKPRTAKRAPVTPEPVIEPPVDEPEGVEVDDTDTPEPVDDWNPVKPGEGVPVGD